MYQYLLSSSFQSKNVTKSIPFLLSLRIVRTCIDPVNREIRFQELKMLLLERGNNEKAIESSIDRAKKVPQQKAIKKS